MNAMSRKVSSVLFEQVAITRDTALSVSERLSAGNSLISSLEYLANRRNIRIGGLNDWAIMRDLHVRHSSRPVQAVLDLISHPNTTTMLHVARVAVSIGLITPGSMRWRGTGNIFLGITGAALYPRHRFGTDGSDQVAALVQTTAGAARISSTPEVRDALIWYLALQSNLSYLVSGWFKLLGQSWRNGEALGGIMRTRTYGNERFWELTQRFPKASRWLARGTMALECGFPVVYLCRGKLVRPILLSAASFHAANGFLMGLGRFVTAFLSMHPMVAYTALPEDYPAARTRDDRILSTGLVVTVAAVVGANIVGGVRRLRSIETYSNSQRLKTRHGNDISYDIRLRSAEPTPIVVFVAGVGSPSEQFGWVIDTILRESTHDLLTYSRAGYGPSRYRSTSEYTLQEAVDDLVDLISGALPENRDVVFVGHSLGGELARRAGFALGKRVRGVVYVDSSHPAELQRSEQQRESVKQMEANMRFVAGSIKLGLGAVVLQPPWLGNLPYGYRRRAFAQYADSRMWTAGIRECKAVRRDFYQYVDKGIGTMNSHAMVISADQTVARSVEQRTMQNDLADAHRSPGNVVKSEVVEGADHDTILTDAEKAVQIGRSILGFVDLIK